MRIIKYKLMQNQGGEKCLNLNKLKRLIESGVSAIPIDKEHQSAVLVIGDTGVGKTTILSFLARRKLIVRVVGLNTVIDSEDQGGLKIGHDKFSETTVPSKIIIDKQVFFDCSGFKDNRGQEYEISNSFFLQRLFDIYNHIKILLMVDETSITETRADKLPKLIKNLLKAFQNLTSIQDGVILLINRAKPEYTHKDYSQELIKLTNMKGESGYLFSSEEREFLEFLVKKQRICLFKQASKDKKDLPFEYKEENLTKLIKDASYVKSKHIKNIISESAKLSIRDYMDRVAITSDGKLEKMCRQIIKEITIQGQTTFSSSLENVMKIKQTIIEIISEIKNSKNKEILNVLNKKVQVDKLLSFQQDLSAVFFFKDIYDKSDTYFVGVKNKIISEFSLALTNLDQEIIILQKRQQQLLKYKRTIQDSEATINSIKLQLETREKQLDEQNKKHSKLLNEMTTEIEKLRQQINTKTKTLQKTLHQNNALKQNQQLGLKQKELLQNDLNKIKFKFEQKEKQLETQKQNKCNQLSQTAIQIQLLKQQAKNKNKTLELLEHQILELKQRQKSKNKQIEQKQALITSIKQQLQQKIKQLQESTQKKINSQELDELTMQIKHLRLQYDDKTEQVQLLLFENQGLRHEIDVISHGTNSHNVSLTSKAKYPEVNCTHFKNGGKCKKCIAAWKETKKIQKTET